LKGVPSICGGSARDENATVFDRRSIGVLWNPIGTGANLIAICCILECIKANIFLISSGMGAGASDRYLSHSRRRQGQAVRFAICFIVRNITSDLFAAFLIAMEAGNSDRLLLHSERKAMGASRYNLYLL